MDMFVSVFLKGTQYKKYFDYERQNTMKIDSFAGTARK